MNTPEEVVDQYTRALQEHNLEQCVALKAFDIEAASITRNRRLKYPNEDLGDEVTSKISAILETAFRKEKIEDGFPDLNGVTWHIQSTQISNDMVIVIQTFVWQDGTSSTEDILVALTGNGWRLIVNKSE